MSIRILPPEISDQIAAGEVVERPASVVKECVENALDANATQIDITLEKSGKDLIRIQDNGSGMSREDALLAPKRHATSKIRTIDDLFAIGSFGFRGEALAAIGSVSVFTLLTRREDDPIATKITIRPNQNPTVEDAAAPTGTIVEVRDLFCTTPARRQYLKTDETEYRTILKEVEAFALAHPQVGFRMVRDGRTAVDFPATPSAQVRLAQVVGKTAENFLTVESAGSNMRLTGSICRAEESRRTRGAQFLFVNGRFIEDGRLTHAIRETYIRTAGLEKGWHPTFVLHLTLDPILVDVNVHPRKKEVKFAEPSDVYSLLRQSVTQTLRTASHTFAHSGGGHSPLFVPPTRMSFGDRYHQESSGEHRPSFSFPSGASAPRPSISPVLSSIGDTSPTPQDGDASHSPLPEKLTLIGQVENKFIVAQSETGLFFFDQHALHERQRFEMLAAQIEQKSLQVQPLLLPVTVELSTLEVSILREHTDFLESLGLGVTFDAARQVSLHSMPSLLCNDSPEEILQNLARYLEEGGVGAHIVETALRRMLEYRSCRGSVKFGERLEPEEMQALLDAFLTTRWRGLCPHGRPNYFFLPFEHLAQYFHRG